MRAFRYPNVEEIEAVERAARRARAEEFARIARAGFSALKSLFGRPQAGIRGARHA
jgi:hypothetical protein